MFVVFIHFLLAGDAVGQADTKQKTKVIEFLSKITPKNTVGVG